MTEQEAINALRLEGGLEIAGKLPRTIEFFKGLDMAIDALEEIQKYRAIGTVEECREAEEKQKAKKPVNVRTKGFRYTDTYRCPSCSGNFRGTGIADYCYHCGQALDWGKA